MKHDYIAVEIMKMPENKAENADFQEQLEAVIEYLTTVIGPFVEKEVLNRTLH